MFASPAITRVLQADLWQLQPFVPRTSGHACARRPRPQVDRPRPSQTPAALILWRQPQWGPAPATGNVTAQHPEHEHRGQPGPCACQQQRLRRAPQPVAGGVTTGAPPQAPVIRPTGSDGNPPGTAPPPAGASCLRSIHNRTGAAPCNQENRTERRLATVRSRQQQHLTQDQKPPLQEARAARRQAGGRSAEEP